MADEGKVRLEAALEKIAKVAEIAGGYLKKEAKEDIQEAVSTIRDCFASMKSAYDDIIKENTQTRKEVKEACTATDGSQEANDSSAARQVVPPIGQCSEPRSQLLPATAGRDEAHPQLLTSNGEEGNALTNEITIMETKISEKIRTQLQDMMENITSNLKSMIKEEITQHTAGTGRNREERETETNTRGKNENREPRNERKDPTSLEQQPTAEQQSSNEGTWVEVVKRRRGNKPQTIQTPTIIGTKQTADPNKEENENELQAVYHKAWLYIGHLHRNTTNEMVERHLKKLKVAETTDCEELQKKGTLKAYKVGIPLRDLHKVTDPGAWPEGAVIRRYRFRSREQGASLDSQENASAQ